MRRPALEIADFLRASVEWSDRTRHGTTLSGRIHAVVRERLYPRTTKHLEEGGPRLSVAALADAVARDRDDEGHAAIVADPDFFTPDEEKVTPAALRLTSTFTGESIRVPLGHKSVAELGASLRDPTSERPLVLGRLLAETAALAQARGLSRARVIADDRRPLFVGHAAVSWSDGELRLWTDPFLTAKSPRYPRRYQPLGPLDAPEREHVVLLTHSHPDHFDPASLLLFPATTRFVIPEIPRETPLSINLKLRLRQLGFTAIIEAPWWTAIEVGGFTVTSLPFYGEQPVGWGAEPIAEYNRGNTYAIRTPDGRTSLLLADSGSDPRGSIAALARRLRRELGPIDALFANHRRWRLHPPQYLLTSVPHFLCYVPSAEVGVRQQIMLDPEALAHLAEALSARWVVPYAMGGARWHEEIGLGFDHLTSRRSTEFDADGHELDDEIEGHPGMRLRRGFTPVRLAAGQRLGDRGEATFLRGLAAPKSSEFRRIREPAPLPYLLVSGIAVTREVLGGIAALTTLDGGSFMVASDRFCEVYTTPGAGGEFARAMLGRYLLGVRAVSAERRTPITGAPFTASPALFRRYCAALSRAFHGLRSGLAIDRALALALDERTKTPLSLVATVQRELLEHGRVPVDTRTRRAGSSPALAGIARARPLVERHGRAAVERALLTAKVIHNLVETARAWRGVDAIDEGALLRAVYDP